MCNIILSGFADLSIILVSFDLSQTRTPPYEWTGTLPLASTHVLMCVDGGHSTKNQLFGPHAKSEGVGFTPTRIYSLKAPPDSAAKPPLPVTEVATFTSATDAFSLANTNVSISDSLTRLAPVARAALDAGLRVRGYASVVVTCPYSGRVDPRRVRDVSKELMQMGCYEVSCKDSQSPGDGNPFLTFHIVFHSLRHCQHFYSLSSPYDVAPFPLHI